jgi:predicted tellurium resistance membrane protein TerC
MLDHLASLLALTLLEIVLGIDNIVVVAVIAGSLPPAQRERARLVGLSLAMLTRLALLASIVWVARLTNPLLTVAELTLSGRDLLMLAGGLFLIVKAVRELHKAVEEAGLPARQRPPATGLGNAVAQIVALDLVFSLDSVMTAVGMARELWVMALAIVIAVLIMLLASGPIIRFIQAHPTLKVLALAFVLLIGLALLTEGLGLHIPKGYLYFAMLFSVLVEGVNITLARRRRHARKLVQDAGTKP